MNNKLTHTKNVLLGKKRKTNPEGWSTMEKQMVNKKEVNLKKYCL